MFNAADVRCRSIISFSFGEGRDPDRAWGRLVSRLLTYVIVVAGLVYSLVALRVQIGPLLGALGIGGAGIELVHAFGITRVRLDVVIQIPAVVFVDKKVCGHEFPIHILGRSIGTRHPLARDDD